LTSWGETNSQPEQIMKRTLLAAASLLAYPFSVAQVSNLCTPKAFGAGRRFPNGRTFGSSPANENSQDSQAGSAAIQQVGNLRYSTSGPPGTYLLAALSLVCAYTIAQWNFNSGPRGNPVTAGTTNSFVGCVVTLRVC
jgi:hypothetical protein